VRYLVVGRFGARAYAAEAAVHGELDACANSDDLQALFYNCYY